MKVAPCPFCSNANMAYWDYSVFNHLDDGISVFCPNCNARGPKKPTQDEAIEAWNKGVQ